MEKKYLKLLGLQQELKNTGQSLSRGQRNELLEYDYQLIEHFRWEQKKFFIEVMRDFLEDKINLDHYIHRFWEIESRSEETMQKLISDFESLETFEPDIRSVGFAILIENLLSDIRLVEPDDSIRTSDEISPEELIQGIKEFLPKIQEY